MSSHAFTPTAGPIPVDAETTGPLGSVVLKLLLDTGATKPAGCPPGADPGPRTGGGGGVESLGGGQDDAGPLDGADRPHEIEEHQVA